MCKYFVVSCAETIIAGFLTYSLDKDKWVDLGV